MAIIVGARGEAADSRRRLALPTALLVLWVVNVGVLLVVVFDFGLFGWISGDYSSYYAQSMVLRMGDPTEIYDVTVIDRYLRPLAVYSHAPERPLVAGPVAYPPLFAWLFIPFTWVSPPVRFFAWTAVNLAGLVWLVRWVVGQFERPERLPMPSRGRSCWHSWRCWSWLGSLFDRDARFWVAS